MVILRYLHFINFQKVSQFRVFSNSVIWEVEHETSHEVAKIGDSLYWHSVIHGNSDTWVESVGLNLGDSALHGHLDESGLKLDISVVNSEDDVDSASIAFVGNLGFVETIRAVDEVPEHLGLHVGDLVVICEATHLVHVRAVEPGDIHWEDGWSVIICVWRLFEQIPVAKDWNILVSTLSDKIVSNNHDSASCWSQILLSSHVDHSELVPWDWLGADV